MELIWVCVTGAVMGFESEEIIRFEEAFSAVPDADYWAFFNWFFQDVLSGKEASCFSTLWTKPAAWSRLNALR